MLVDHTRLNQTFFSPKSEADSQRVSKSIDQHIAMISAILVTACTAIIQPAAYSPGVAAGLATNRVQFFENSPITSLDRNKHWVATMPKGKVTAPNIVLAVDGHLNSFGLLEGRLMLPTRRWRARGAR